MGRNPAATKNRNHAQKNVVRIPRVTPRQLDILRAIHNLKAAHRFTPSYAEIGAATGITAASTICRHIDNLETAGVVSRDPDSTYRSIQITTAGLRVLGLEVSSSE